VTAPYNPDPQWPQGYHTVLAGMGVSRDRFSYYANWVRRFFKRHPGRRRRDLGRGEIETYLRELVADEGMRMWQVRQARNALEWYYELFRGISLDGQQAEGTG
jgi:hypothetical protein